MILRGIYIISFEDRTGIFYKLGFSMNFHARFYNYPVTIIGPQKIGMKIFRINGTKEDIYKKEQEILRLTKEYHIPIYGEETRSYVDIFLIEDYLGIKVEDFDPIKPSIKELKEDQKIMKENLFALYDYQEKALGIFKDKFNINKFFQGIYCLATGLGKTIIAIHICLYHLEKYPDENILWITFRNDIVDSQEKSFKKHLGNKFILCNNGNFKKQCSNNKGKVIVVLRQSLLKSDTNLNIHGIIYDECHDASKKSKKESKDNIEVINGLTYDVLLKLKKEYELRYMLGFSATPLTENERQNKGVKELYGEQLYQYSLIKACEDKRLLKPIIEYISYDKDTFHDELKNIINKPELIYKKGIIWLPSIKAVDSFKDVFKMENIKIVHNTSDSESISTKVFAEEERNCIMITCDKFTTGFDGKNMEFGINVHLNEAGNITLQKIGRFTRDNKIGQKFAYFFQFCEIDNNQYDKLVESICRNLDSMGINKENDFIGRGSSYNKLLDCMLIKCKDGYKKLKDFEELRAKVETRHFHGKSLAKFMQYKNKRIIEEHSEMTLIDLIHHKKLYVTKDDCEHFSSITETPIKGNVSNYVMYCLGEKLFKNLTDLICYDLVSFKNKCKEKSIKTLSEYENKACIYEGLPPSYLLDNGFYFELNNSFNIVKILEEKSIFIRCIMKKKK